MKLQSPRDRRIAGFVLIVVIGLALFLCWNRSIQNSPLSDRLSSPAPHTKESQLDPEKEASVDSRRVARHLIENVGLNMIVVEESPPALAPPHADLIQGGYGESARLVDKAGNTLLQATATAPIYSASPSPSGNLIILSRGDGVNQLYRLSPFSIIRQLPLSPDIPRATAFEPWQWIDENTLIGVSAVEKPPEELEGLTAAEREAQWREKTVLYLLDLKSETLTPIHIAIEGLSPSFRVIEARMGGLMHVEWDEQEASKKLWIKVSGM